MNPAILEKIKSARNDYSEHDLALGFIRYEALRKLNPKQFETLHLRNVAGEFENFDDMVDELILK